MLDSYALWAIFWVGFLGGAHCAGMCGGILGVLSMGGSPRLSLHLAYNAGRIASYMLAGAIAGAVGGGALSLADQLPVRLLLYVLANVMLLLLGLYLLGLTRSLIFLERLGQRLWRLIQPWSRLFLPVMGVRQALPLGVLWGWLPCGLVYSALITALSSGSAWQGSLLMLAFGLGTLPNLLVVGVFLTHFRGGRILAQEHWLRRIAGAVVCCFGLWGLWAGRQLWGAL